MIERFRDHSFSRAVCLGTAQLFEQHAARDLVEAQHQGDSGAVDRVHDLQARAKLAQQRADAWRETPPDDKT